MISRLGDLVKFRIERFLLGGAQNRLIFIAILLLLVSVAGGLIVQMVDPELASLKNAVWWAFLRLSDPGYLGDDYGAGKRVVATIITLLGYVLFMGALVAIMTQWLHATIRKLESGLTPISKNGHILILGWTNRTASIVREIFHSGSRVKRFLSHLDRGGLHVVILAPEVGPELTIELKEQLGELWDSRKITFRSGIPIRIEDLKRVDCLNASIIILPGKALYEETVESIDAETIKTLLSLSKLAKQNKMAFPPPVVTEVMDVSRMSVTERSYTGKIEVVCSIAIISRLICQSIRNPGSSYVNKELMTQESGNALYVRQCPEMLNRPWSDVSRSFSTSVPIGILSTADDDVVLCPDLTYRLKDSDIVIFIAKNLEKTNHLRPTAVSPISTAVFPAPPASRKIKKILILGWSQKFPFIINELSRQETETYHVDLMSVVSTENRLKMMTGREQNYPNVVVRHVEADYTLPKSIESIHPESYDFVLYLASDWINSQEETDCRTILGYMMLEDLLNKHPKVPNTLIELADPANEELFSERSGEVIISPRIISHLVGSIALKMELNSVFNELFESDGAEFHFQNASHYDLKGRVSFQEIQDRVMGNGRIPVGVRKTENGEKSIFLAPNETFIFNITEDDELILLSRLTIAKKT